MRRLAALAALTFALAGCSVAPMRFEVHPIDAHPLTEPAK